MRLPELPVAEASHQIFAAVDRFEERHDVVCIFERMPLDPSKVR